MSVVSLMLAMSLAAASQGAVASDDAWHDSVQWQGRSAHMHAQADGGFVLTAPDGTREIPAPAWRVHTASELFDGLFAMAQDDLRRDSVEAIRDDAFDHGKDIPCHCFETGEKWHYVWTRDLSYAVDLGLWRLDPERARASLRFKLSQVREPSAPQTLLVAQDTGSGGSWPISTDRVVWFLAARHLLDDKVFADEVYHALAGTLAQDRAYIYDPGMGLYRGETSFLDWREQSYPRWTASDVVFLAQSFALSTNVLHVQALRLAQAMAQARGDAQASVYGEQAQALKAAIQRHFWREDRGQYMSYIGGADHPVPYEAYDLLGTSLAITSGVADVAHAKRALAQYPAWPAGSPVIWPERADVPIYHNRAIWPFVSGYSLRAARMTEQPERIDHEIRSLMRGAALASSNMENYELITQAAHVDDGALSGPVVDSPRQLWSVAAYLNMVIEGVFGLQDDDSLAPKLPVSLVPMLFGKGERVMLELHGREIELVRPATISGDLLVADSTTTRGRRTTVTLKSVVSQGASLRRDAPLYAPTTPGAVVLRSAGDRWMVQSEAGTTLYVNGRRVPDSVKTAGLPRTPQQTCVSATRIDKQGVESLHSQATCAGATARVTGAWPRQWTSPMAGDYQLSARYANNHGPVNTGITAGVQWVRVQCAGLAEQRVLLVLPHSDVTQESTRGRFRAGQGARCSFRLEPGFNMTYLAHFAHYTGGQGGAAGVLNPAPVDTLLITPLGNNAP